MFDAKKFSGGLKTLADKDTPEPLFDSPMPCLFVRLGAPVDDDGEALNSKPVFIAESAAKATAAQGAIPLLPDNASGLVIHIADAAKLFIKVGADGEGVAYQVFELESQ